MVGEGEDYQDRNNEGDAKYGYNDSSDQVEHGRQEDVELNGVIKTVEQFLPRKGDCRQQCRYPSRGGSQPFHLESYPTR